MTLDRYLEPGDRGDQIASLNHSDERKQAWRLYDAVTDGQTEQPRLLWPLAGRRLRLNGGPWEIDALLYLKGRGFIVLDFKTANPTGTYNELDYARVWNQAKQLKEMFSLPATRAAVSANPGGGDPPVMPMVGFYNVPRAVCAEWEKARADQAREYVPYIPKEVWNEEDPVARFEAIESAIEEAFTACRGEFPNVGVVWNEDTTDRLIDLVTTHASRARGLSEVMFEALSTSNTLTQQSVPWEWQRVQEMTEAPTSEEIRESSDGLAIVINRTTVTGLAGSGKTWTAAYGAVRLAREGRAVLLFCRSQPLAAHLRSALREFEESSRSAGLDLSTLPVDVLTPNELLAGSADPDSALFSAKAWNEACGAWSQTYEWILVDEAQDFAPLSDGTSALDHLLGLLPEGGKCVVFGDREQVTLDGVNGVMWNPPTPPIHHLSRNYRSTPEITLTLNNVAGCGYDEARIAPLNYALSPKFVPLNDTENLTPGGLWKLVLRELNSAREQITDGLGRLSPSQTAVLFNDRRWLTATFDEMKKHGYGDLQKLQWRTVDEFKGLEAEFVLLVLTDHPGPGGPREEDFTLARLQADFYTGASRARAVLSILHPQTLLG